VNLKPACFLLSLCYVGSAAALGLGEISVRSYLGRPLHATIPILDPTPNTTADCFSLGAQKGSIAPPLHAQLSLERSGGETVLHIRTTRPINDPIAQFELASDCEVRLQRDYVVLLDPPAQVETAVATQEAPAIGKEVPVSAARRATSGVAPAPRASRRRHPPKHAVTVRAHASASRQPHAPDRQPTASATTPRLILSGKDGQLRNESLALQFDTKLPDLNRPRPEGLTATEMSDENAALNHKLADLEAQLLELQRRNAQLDARAAVAANVTPQPTSKPVQWPIYLLITVLLTGGIALVFWLQRRSRSRQTSDERLADAWIPLAGTARPVSGQMESDPFKQSLSRQTEKPAGPKRMPEIAPPPPPIQSTEVKDDILDQAEVYMAHGHGELAIHLLQEHLRNAPDESPVPWLLLLDLLHRDGDTPGYTAASAECRRYFNINLTSHPISQDSESGNGLEAYPHLLEQLVKVWGTPDTDNFFRDLLYDNRGGTRIGFEPSAYRDILLLRTIAQNVMPLAA
jgi:Tfp pilus assembly protein FimV